MQPEMIKTLRVGAVQLASQFGQRAENLSRAESLVEQAARAGASLVVLPELFSSGYQLTEAIWDYGETRQGPTLAWMKATARRLGIWLGGSLIEVEGADFYNSFPLVTPDGSVAGWVRKQRPESFYFRQIPGPHSIDTPLGRIGVGICADNSYRFLPPLVAAAGVDLMLMPHASPAPARVSRLISPADIAAGAERARRMAPLYAHMLGVPAVFVNLTGAIPAGHWEGWITGAMGSGDFAFPGQTSIVDGDERVVAHLDTEEGVLVTDVTLDPARKHYLPPRTYGEFLHPGSAALRLVLRLEERLGVTRYRRSRVRRQKAAEITSQPYG